LDTASIVLVSLIGIYTFIKFIGYLSRLGIKQVTPHALDQMKGLTLLDTRTDKEYKQGHIPGAIHIPLSGHRDQGQEASQGQGNGGLLPEREPEHLGH